MKGALKCSDEDVLKALKKRCTHLDNADTDCCETLLQLQETEGAGDPEDAKELKEDKEKTLGKHKEQQQFVNEWLEHVRLAKVAAAPPKGSKKKAKGAGAGGYPDFPADMISQKAAAGLCPPQGLRYGQGTPMALGSAICHHGSAKASFGRCMATMVQRGGACSGSGPCTWQSLACQLLRARSAIFSQLLKQRQFRFRLEVLPPEEEAPRSDWNLQDAWKHGSSCFVPGHSTP